MQTASREQLCPPKIIFGKALHLETCCYGPVCFCCELTTFLHNIIIHIETLKMKKKPISKN